MSAEIPWTVGPGETLPKAPPPACTCGSGAHPRRCSAHPWAFDEHVAEMNAPEAEAKPEGDSGPAIYTQAQWDAAYMEAQNLVVSVRAKAAQDAMLLREQRDRASEGEKRWCSDALSLATERDKALLDLQRVRGEAVYWQEQAAYWKYLAEGGR